MIGILFFGIIAIWALIALALGIKLPKWLRIQRYRPLWATVFVALVFFAPVADEIIAYPQMQALCKHDRLFEMEPGMDEKGVYGRTVYSEERKAFIRLWPSSIEILQWSTAYVDAVTKQTLFTRSGAEPLRGMLGIPNGSSGGQMAAILSACDPTGESFDSKGIPSRFSHLNLTKIPKP
jgi:hypothetical protein